MWNALFQPLNETKKICLFSICFLRIILAQTNAKCDALDYYRPQTKFVKVMFLHLSVSHSVHRGMCVPQCMLGYTPQKADIPLGSRHPPGSRHPLGSRHPPVADNPPGSRHLAPVADTPR